MVEFGFISLYTGCVRGWWREGLLCTWQDHAYTGRQAMHGDVRADTTQGGAWLQSDNFGWVGLDCLTDRRGCRSKQKTAVISATTT